MKIYIGADHRGFELKAKISDFLRTRGHEIVDVGDQKLDPQDDYPMFAGRLATSLLASPEPDPKGILICGSGQGVVMAANRFKGIRASLVWNEYEAKSARSDDDSNVLCLPAHEMTDFNKAADLITIWLNTPFLGAERYARRIRELDNLN